MSKIVASNSCASANPNPNNILVIPIETLSPGNECNKVISETYFHLDRVREDSNKETDLVIADND